MRRVIIIIVIVALVAAGGYYAYHRYGTAQAEKAAEQAAANQTNDLTSVIWASGELQPRIWAGLSPSATGIVQAIYVSEGDWVQKGELLLELDNSVLESEAEVAGAQVAEAQAALDKLLAGATDAEIASARANVAAAQAGVSQAAGQLAEADASVELARTAVETAQRQYDELASHPTPVELDAAMAEESIAQAAVTQAQAAYNVVKGDPNIERVARIHGLADRYRFPGSCQG